jgi:hypothetical protein
MPAKLTDLSLAFGFANSGDGYGNQAFVSRRTGEVYMRSEYGDPISDMPEDIDDDALYLVLPDKRDLNLGGRLVDRFAEEIAPEHADDIHDVFAGKGAYRRLKSYLQRKGLLERWYAFENAEEERALRAWCAENGIALED